MFQTATLYQSTQMHLLHFPFERRCPFTDTVRPILGRLHSLPEWYVAISAVKALDSVGMLKGFFYILFSMRWNPTRMTSVIPIELKKPSTQISLIVINKTKKKKHLIWRNWFLHFRASGTFSPSSFMLSLVHSIENKSQLQDIISVNWNYCLCSFGWVPSVYSDKHFPAYYILMYYSFKKKMISYCRFFFFFGHTCPPFVTDTNAPWLTSIHPSIQCQLLLKSKDQWPWDRTLSTCTCQSVSQSVFSYITTTVPFNHRKNVVQASPVRLCCVQWHSWSSSQATYSTFRELSISCSTRTRH